MPGISGGGTLVEHGNDFPATAAGTSVKYLTLEGSYKLPGG
jgi:hypothetical protein